MTAAQSNKVEASESAVCEVSSVEELEEFGDDLFLESLVSEANRLLDGLNTMQFRVEEQWGDPSLRVTFRDTHRPVRGFTDQEMLTVADKVRELRGLMFGQT
ncbi:MAG: flagellar protein FlaG [Magnetococcales bacterium]|nr:flagellar protein FlaG [Magnetococcales bacterium]